jgi:SAM-dependent methyltransferase
MNGDASGASAEEYWDTRYSANDRIWSGKPNALLIREVSELSPGRALDLGCGEGADAIWLAQRGWHVTAVDVSRIALARAAEHARQEGVADRIDWQWHDLTESFPAGAFDLVSAHFLHSEIDLPRERILRTAAASLSAGGVLLIVGHVGCPSWETGHHPDIHFPTPEEVLTSLDLPPAEWELLLSGEHERRVTGPDGQPATRTDNLLKLRRRPDDSRPYDNGPDDNGPDDSRPDDSAPTSSDGE